jgi:bifunctional non-homologous end joining protein LigD
MALEEYRAKRHFDHTPEPAGDAGASPERGIFVIQKHAATALHYDFRLELDGVLLSWAVPKGPSFDPKDKRLAVHVEDHPIDYAGFEGIIPAGEYGGGTVIVWDRGQWEPLGDAHAGLTKGDFKFRLFGGKLVGTWVLVRLKPRGNEKRENWLLIKERDEYARPHEEYDVLVERPESASSGLTLEQVAEGVATPTPAPEMLPESPLHAPLAPALCTLVAEPPVGVQWIGEVKYDGYRLQIALDSGAARCYSRNGEDVTARFAPLARAAEKLPATTALLDGEAVVLDERGVSDFGALQRALSEDPSRITFAAFDLLHLNGHDLRPMPTTTRRDLLGTLLAEQPAGFALRAAEYVVSDVPSLLELACAQGLEGVVAKLAGAPYPTGRTRSWRKIKCRPRAEFVVGGYTDPKASRTGFGALLLGTYDDAGALHYAGRAGSGFSEREIAAISERLTALAADSSPFGAAPKVAGAHWVRPELVVEVAFAEWTAEGLLRQPSFLGMRDDVSAADVRREAPTPDADDAAEDVSAEPPAPGSDDIVAGVRISNPGKRLFPGGGATKLEIARYYEAIAPWMLPEVADRLLTLVRCPVGDGHSGCFYQRHPDRGLPAAVGTLDHTLAEHAEGDRWLRVADVEGLVALAQMGVAEIHTWLSRVDAPARPDRIVFDLDPGPGVTMHGIAEAAHAVRAEFEALGFSAFVKSTGSKGLHVVVPVEPVWEFTRVRVLARALAEKIATSHPKTLTSKMAKSERDGRIFLDYVRNSEGASAVAPYSTRFLEGPPVAVPLVWDEVDGSLDLRTLTPTSVLERVREGSDPWKELDRSAAGSAVLKAAERALGIGS